MNEILLSVYCLAYNHENYIEKALEGFVNQKTNFKYEVFVHDDCSSDNTSSIIKRYASAYPEIIKPIFQKENQYSKGVSISTEIILPYMKGKYVAVCEGDDYWCDENKLQMQVEFLENHSDYVACVHNSFEYNCKTNRQKIMYKTKKDYDITFKDVIEGGGVCYQTSSLVYRREFMTNRPDFFKVIAPVGDWPLSIYLTLNGKIRFFGKTMSVYRIYTNNSWTSINFDLNQKKKHLEKEKDFLSAVNIYTKFQYDELITNVKLRKQYLLNEYLKNINELKNKKYRNIWKDKSIIFRLKRFIKRQRFFYVFKK